jgi:hypothetical protein
MQKLTNLKKFGAKTPKESESESSVDQMLHSIIVESSKKF